MDGHTHSSMHIHCDVKEKKDAGFSSTHFKCSHCVLFLPDMKLALSDLLQLLFWASLFSTQQP